MRLRFSFLAPPSNHLAALLCGLCLLALAPQQTVAQTSQSAAPALMLAKVYHPGIDLTDYWVSEKYDGVRGYWDGRQLFTRGGERVQAPTWFTAGWPNTPLDGELWTGHGQFEEASGTVRQQTPDDAAWRKLRFMVFDLPAHGGPFTERLAALNAVVAQIQQPWVRAVAQTPATSHAALQRHMREVVKAGGEGLMLHRGASVYSATRNGDLLKMKPHDDAEARVVGHVQGQGKYSGVLGSLAVETVASGNGPLPGIRFKIGTGFTDKVRSDPPGVGSVVTYRYRGLTGSGVPRFASFVRVVPEQPQQR